MVNRREVLLGGLAAMGAAGLRAERSRKIEVGCCAPVRDLEPAAKIGFDYLEPGAADIAAMSEEEFQRVKNQVLASPIRCEAFNSFIRRKELVVVGPAVDLTPVLEYVDGALDRCKQLGASVIVWGSAGSRNVPEGFSRDRAWEQIAEFLTQAAPLARKHSLVISIEPLRNQESNILNTAHEAFRMVREVNRPEIRLMVDYYHFRVENEDPEIFEQARGYINHLHFANPEGRLWPRSLEEDPHYREFFAVLKRVGWQGGISVEGRGSVAVNGAETLKVLRTLSA